VKSRLLSGISIPRALLKFTSCCISKVLIAIGSDACRWEIAIICDVTPNRIQSAVDEDTSQTVNFEWRSSCSIRVGLVEDEPETRAALVKQIALQPDMNLVLTATNRAQALALLPSHPVDVLLVDLGLPDGSGLDVIAEARGLWPNCNVLVATVFGDEAHVLPSIDAGATGYILKDSNTPALIDEIRSVHSGGSPISPMVARKILTRTMLMTTQAREKNCPQESGQVVSLSARELLVLQLVSKGFNADEVASTMGISSSTVRTFVRRIYVKLEVRTRVGAIDVARRRGILLD
jgi:DNA-binding NarL/FixJ family response regulator